MVCARSAATFLVTIRRSVQRRCRLEPAERILVTARGMAFGPFLKALNGRLDQMSEQELREAIRALASDLRPADRASFLSRVSQRGSRQIVADGLLDGIKKLLDRIRSGEFYDGWGWDDSIHAERAFGDESWASEMDTLFDRAFAAFRAGQLDVARKAYGRLLHAIWDGGDVAEQLPGEDPPGLLETDLTEAAACYLRALYETTPATRRAEELLDELSDLPVRPGLAELRAASGEDLPGLTEFLPAWIALLRADEDGSEWSRAWMRTLLIEAVLLQNGVDGLADLARERSADEPELHLELVRQLEREGQIARAVEAAREALAVLPAGRVRASIADRLGALEPDPEARLEARRDAWRSRLSRERLLALIQAARESGDLGHVLDRECDVLPPPGRRGQRSHDERLACALLLIAGRIDVAVERARALDDDRADPEHPVHVVVPFLALAATGAGSMPPGAPTLKATLATVDRPPRWGTDAGEKLDEVGGTLAGTLEESLPGESTDTEARRRWLTVGQEMIASAVAETVGGSRRHAYELVARLVAGHAEALASCDADGREFVAGFRARYPRHVAFRRELDRLCAGSPALGRL